MALIRYGGGITQMSGSIGGTTHARNRYGNYTRSRTKPVNPKSSRQTEIRSAVSFLASYWFSDLTPAERTAWNLYGSSVAMKNRLGETVYMTGFNHFIRSNTLRQYQGQSIVDAGPTTFELPEKDNTITITGSAATQQISLSFNNALPWANEVGGMISCFLGQPQNKTRNFFNGPWKHFTSFVGGAVPPVSPKVVNASYGIAQGQALWIYCRISRADGRLSEAFRTQCFCGA
jgi:hypothetical protein